MSPTSVSFTQSPLTPSMLLHQQLSVTSCSCGSVMLTCAFVLKRVFSQQTTQMLPSLSDQKLYGGCVMDSDTVELLPGTTLHLSGGGGEKDRGRVDPEMNRIISKAKVDGFTAQQVRALVSADSRLRTRLSKVDLSDLQFHAILDAAAKRWCMTPKKESERAQSQPPASDSHAPSKPPTRVTFADSRAKSVDAKRTSPTQGFPLAQGSPPARRSQFQYTLVASTWSVPMKTWEAGAEKSDGVFLVEDCECLPLCIRVTLPPLMLKSCTLGRRRPNSLPCVLLSFSLAGTPLVQMLFVPS